MQKIKKLNDLISTQKPLYTIEVKTSKKFITLLHLRLTHGNVKHNNFYLKVLHLLATR